MKYPPDRTLPNSRHQCMKAVVYSELNPWTPWYLRLWRRAAKFRAPVKQQEAQDL